MKNVLYVGIGVIVLLVVIMVVVGLRENEEVPGIKTPNITGVDADGVEFSLADPEYRGKVVMIDFWASWCGPCRAMFPHNIELVKRMKGRPFVLLGVSADYTFESFQNTQRRGELNWRSWFDKGGKIAEAYKVDAYPSIFLIDHDGKMRKKFRGNPGTERLDTAIEELVQEAEKAG